MRRAPSFWWRDDHHPAATLLRPAGAIYGWITARRMARPGTALTVPVICVGNLVAGGAGKTPVAIALARLLSRQGERPAILSRGYGRSGTAAELRRVIAVDPSRNEAAAVGDEPLLLAAVAPTYVSTDRVAAGRRAIADGASILLLDDGLQNPALVKRISIAVVDGASGVGNGLCVPAGPLRAPLSGQWPAVTCVCVIGSGAPGAAVAALARRRGCRVFSARLEPDPGALAALRGMPLFAFAGIGRPEKFFATLDENGLDVRGRRSFPDHHRFTREDCAALVWEADGASLVTTAKDKVRLPPDVPATVLPVSLVWTDEAAFAAFLAERLVQS